MIRGNLLILILKLINCFSVIKFKETIIYFFFDNVEYQNIGFKNTAVNINNLHYEKYLSFVLYEKFHFYFFYLHTA